MENNSVLCARGITDTADSYIEGRLEIPSGMPDISCLLCASATAKTAGTLCSSGSVTVKGSVLYQILYVTAEGEPMSFDARCDFEFSAAGAYTEDMSAAAVTSVTDTAYSASARSVDIKSKLCSYIFAGTNREIVYPDTEGAQVKAQTAKLFKISDIKAAEARTQGRITIGQNMPEVKKVLFTSSAAFITDIHRDTGRIALEGELRLNIVYLGTDKNAPLQYMNETVPFSHFIAVSGQGEPELYAVPSGLYVEKDEVSPDVLNYDCSIDIAIKSGEYCEANLALDAYCVKNEYELKYDSACVEEISSGRPQKRMVRTLLSIPENLPEASRVLTSSASAEVSDAVCKNGSISLRGSFYVTVCYTTVEEGMKSAKLEAPFETEVSADVSPEYTAKPAIFCEYAVAEGSGRDIELRVCTVIYPYAEKCASVKTVCGITLGEETPKNSGMTLVLGASQDPWEVMKAYRTAPEGVIDLDGGRYLVIT